MGKLSDIKNSWKNLGKGILKVLKVILRPLQKKK